MKSTKPVSNVAVGYIRVSTEEQASSGISLQAQEEAVRAYCAMRGLSLVEVAVDAGISAKMPLRDREGGERAMTLLREGGASHMVAYKLDRLFRNCAECLEVTSAWDRREIALHLVDIGGQTVDTSSAMGRFFITILAGAAEMERGLISERTKFALAAKKERGERIGGAPAYGWRIEGEALVEVPHEQEGIGLARDLRAQGASLEAIGQELSKAGFPSKRGGRWHAKTVKSILEVGRIDVAFEKSLTAPDEEE